MVKLLVPVFFCFCALLYFLLILPLLFSIFSTIKKNWKKLSTEFSALLASFGLAFFIFAHLQFIPIADRIVKEKDEVKVKEEEKTQKSRRFDEKDNLPFRRRGGFPRRKVFAT